MLGLRAISKVLLSWEGREQPFAAFPIGETYWPVFLMVSKDVKQTFWDDEEELSQ